MLRQVLCPYCYGKRTFGSVSETTCPVCEGVGSALVFQDEYLVKLECRRCSGTGKASSPSKLSYATLLRPSIGTNYINCPECQGKGYVETFKSWAAKMPPPILLYEKD